MHIKVAVQCQNMERYVEMGYSALEAEEAVQRYGDDLHAGCHWLMMRSDLGTVPQRLKRRRVGSTDQSYLGSKIRFQNASWVVDDFDPQHALIRLASDTVETKRWEHMSDQRMEWNSVQHNIRDTSIPKPVWKHVVGSIKLPTSMLIDRPDTQSRPLTVSTALDVFIRDGRPSAFGKEWRMWRTMTALTRECVHEPGREKPRGLFSDDIHNFRVELMSYFLALCDVYNVSQDNFSTSIYENNGIHKASSMFPEIIRSTLKTKMKTWKNPQKFLRRARREWRKECLSMVLFECRAVNKDVVTFDVVFHDMTFVRPRNYEASTHMHFQRLFGMIFEVMKPHANVDGPIHTVFLSNALRDSRKPMTGRTSPPISFKTSLFPYQQNCLTWLLQRENDGPSTSAWGWYPMMADGFEFYASVFGHLSLTKPPSNIKGGLLAQEVGMGKTVEMLALIATQKEAKAENGPTLVVVPTTMLAVWQSEAAAHAPDLKVIRFHGPRRTKNMDDLRESDIVLTTYKIVQNETRRHVPTIGAVHWERIILDESHELRSPNSVTTRAVCRLYAPKRWCISATPWPKQSQSMSSMLSFLGVTPFIESNAGLSWSAAQCLLRHHSKKTPSHIHDLLKSLTFWQKKRHVRLNLPTVSEREIILDNTFESLYTRLVDIVRARVQSDSENVHLRNKKSRLMHYVRWLRLAATHPCLTQLFCFGTLDTSNRAQVESKSVESFVNTLGETEYDHSVRDIIDSWADGNETCTICMDAMDRPTLTPCHHMFCYECIQSAYEHDVDRKCPLCRTPAQNRCLQELAVHGDIPADEQSTTTIVADLQGRRVIVDKETHKLWNIAQGTEGSKCQNIIDMIQTGTDKMIIFTQFHGVWSRLCTALESQNISYSCIQGNMSLKRREKEIHAFQKNKNVRAFVMTTKTASVGITLTAGSHIVFMEPCENKALKKQAIGRAWRIGQERPVTVTTLKTRNTMDEFTSKDLIRHLGVSSGPTRGHVVSL